MKRPVELCPACPVHEEARQRALMRDVERLPVDRLVDAYRSDVYQRVRRLIPRDCGPLDNQRHEELLHSIDRLIQEAARSSTVERAVLAREAEREGMERQQEQDDAGAVARLQWEGWAA